MLGRFLLHRRMMRQVASRMLMRRMVWRSVLVIVALVLPCCLALRARAQVAPGGLSPDDQQASLDQVQQMQDIRAQVLQNMQNAGEDPQAFIQDVQQQMANGTLDFAAMQQQLVQKGYMTQQQVDQVSGGLNRLQGIARTASLNAIKTQLNASDDEWAVLLPKIQKIIDLLPDVTPANSLTPGGNRNLGGLGGRGGLGGLALGQAAPTTDTGKAFRALQEVLQDRNASDDRIASKLSAWRELHEKSRQQLKLAQQDLVSILTLRQEALLLGMGVL